MTLKRRGDTILEVLSKEPFLWGKGMLKEICPLCGSTLYDVKASDNIRGKKSVTGLCPVHENIFWRDTK